MKNCFKFLRLALPCILTLFAAITYAQVKPKRFLLKGVISGTEDGTKVMLFDIEGQRVIDSANTVNGAFVLQGQVERPTACWIRCKNEYATIQVENTFMTFTSPLKEMKLNFSAQGGKEQSLQNELDNLQRGYERIYTYAYDSLNNKLYRDTVQKARLVKEFNKAQDTYMNIYVAFGQKHINSYLGLGIVYRNRQRIPKDSLAMLYSSLPPALKGTNDARALQTYLTKKLAGKGQPFIDFEVRTIEGQPFRLSDLKGKYIYLAFGSFSCGPCRMENREIAKQYNNLSKHVAIVNFSLDINQKEWKAAAKLDKIIWYNVSDMAGMAGKVKTLYNVQAMPTSFLIDPNGVIIERFDGYSDENITKIAGIVSKVK
ncbi:TlpA disulfide reductase family protein [uncultured Mucilaginibacter sp.]|uniref:TlpA disulfide reductase family protein n=1 Tax=uncultured Mucilaginibacter sp. TaxID=797541 RepID=UPI00260332C0|nr:TlpA disulfide reductase family protein [uncultured Mucilaginibacter sp.]